MPYASTRVSRNTRIGGGPLFWLLYATFIGPLWLMGQLLKGAILLLAWAAREATTRHARTREPAQPEDARPATTRGLRDPANRSHAIALTAAALALAALVALAVLGHTH